MFENMENIQRSILSFVSDYEESKTGSIDPWEKMLRHLEAKYERMPEHEKVKSLLRQYFTEEDIRAWFTFPDFDYRSRSLLVEEAAALADPADRPGFPRAAQKLIDRGFLVQVPRPDGSLGYMRAYMLYLAFGAVLTNDHEPLTDLFIDWWLHVLHDDVHLESDAPEHRVLAHQDSLARMAGAQVVGMPMDASVSAGMPDGRISMNLEIPDTRKVLPSDLSDFVLSHVDHMAVIDCVCRAATEARGERQCGYPIEGVCFLFNEAADEAIKVGYGRKVTNEEGIRIMHQLRDMGLVQVISNAERPLSMCNCCSCCCICLSTMARNQNFLATPSRFLAEAAAPEACVGCGKCAASCQMSAVSFGESGVWIDPAACIGCGQCAVRCPAGVISMKVKPGAPGGLARARLNRIYL